MSIEQDWMDVLTYFRQAQEIGNLNSIAAEDLKIPKSTYYTQAFKRLINNAVAAEREACAALSERTKYGSTLDLRSGILNCGCAAAIRQRSALDEH